MNSWFDARILLEFSDAERKKVAGTPKAPNTGKDTDGWVEKEASFLVPEGAVYLKFMPSLFNVEAGTFELDDIVIEETDPDPIEAATKKARAEYEAKKMAEASKRRAKAAASFEATGNLISNGDFQTDSKGKGWPDSWGKPEGSVWGDEDGNRFLSLNVTEPGKTALVYRTIDIPAGIEAIEMTYKARVTGLIKGAVPWNDARIMFEFQDIFGKKTDGSPGATYLQKDTKGWVEKTTRFLVPKDALTLVLMPTLFEAKAGTFDIDDIVLKPTDPEILYAAQREREEVAKARFVPDEPEMKDKWPAMVRVEGNRLVDPEGNEVWLQGLNAGGLETLHHDEQVIKSAVVGVEEWNANAVRLPVKDHFWFGQSPLQKDGGKSYREMIDKIVTLCANRGAYLILDLHRYRAPKQEHADFWKDAAARYKDHPAVLFDLLNEPHDISWEVWRNGGFVGTKKGLDESAFLTDEEKKKNQGFESIGMQAMVEAVRSTGAKNVVIAGGLFWCNDLTGIVNGYALEDTTGNGIMYSWHTYNWHTGWDKLLPVAEKHPILVGELGANVKPMDFIPAEDQEDASTWVPDMLGFIQKHRLNWTAWCFHPKAAPIMISDWKYTPSPGWGVMAKEALGGKQFEMKKMR